MNEPAHQNTAPFCVDYLNLSDCRTRSVEQDGDLLLVVAEYLPQCCPRCGLRGLTSSGTADWTVWDAPHFGVHPTLIQLFVPKIQCAMCGRVEARPEWLYSEHRDRPGVVNEDRVDAGPGNRTWRPTRTRRLIEYILSRVGSLTTFEQIGRETRQSPNAIRAIFKYEFDRWDKERGKDLPTDVSIDEAHHRGNYLGIIADASGGLGIIDMLKDEKQKTFLKRFYESGNRDKVRTLSTDFRKDNRYAYTRKRKGKEAALPSADVIGDRFHFSDKIGDGFDAVRTEVQRQLLERLIAEEMAKFSDAERRQFGEKALKAEALRKCNKQSKGRLKALKEKRHLLFARPENVKSKDRLVVKGLLSLHPTVQSAYELKNQGLEILDADTAEEAAARLNAWQQHVETSPFKEHFEEALGISRKWRKELIAYVVHKRRLHNARIESAIFVLKIRNRMGRGLRFPMLRAVVLWESAQRRLSADQKISQTARALIEKIEPYYDIV